VSLIEGDLRFDFPSVLKVERFDGDGHDMSHCMKAPADLLSLSHLPILN
jgi:hypothetical protein